jgi:hypothetical protein
MNPALGREPQDSSDYRPIWSGRAPLEYRLLHASTR